MSMHRVIVSFYRSRCSTDSVGTAVELQGADRSVRLHAAHHGELAPHETSTIQE